jgi:amino acid transporter
METRVKDVEGTLDEQAGSASGGRLRGGAIGAVTVGAMAMAFEAPSVSMFFNSPFAAAHVGAALPVTFLIAGLAIACVGWNIASFAKKLPTSGYAYTFVSHGLGPRMGFMGGWMTLFAFVLGPMILPPVFGVTLSRLIDRLVGVSIPWWILAGALLLFVGVLVVHGVRQSLEAGMIFLVFEVAVLMIFGAYMVIKGGPEGNDLSTLSPSTLPSAGALASGLIFGLLSFQGFEAAATLGEETKDSQKRLPIAIMAAVGATAVFYVFVSYAATIGWGPSKMAEYGASAGPFSELADNYGGAWLADVFDAVVASGLLAGTIATLNAASRMLFAMGREGVIPRTFARVHPETGTPFVAALSVAVVGGLGGIIFGAAWDPTMVWGFLGTVIALSAIIVYMLVSVAVFAYYRREHRSEFHVISHAVVPLIAVAVMIVPLAIKGGLLWPAPEYPFNLPPYLALAWLVLGIAALVYLTRRRPELLARARAVFSEA